MGSNETATATTGGPRVIAYLTVTGCYRAQIIYFFRGQIGSWWPLGIGLGVGSRLRRIRWRLAPPKGSGSHMPNNSWFYELQCGAGRPVPNTISSGGGLAEGNGSAFNWLSRARRAPSDFPSPVAPPPSCELVATRGAETRERRPEPGLPSQVRDWSRGVPAPG